MLFQGQEFASTAPFQFFADMPESLVQLVREGRKEFLCQWRSIRTSSMIDSLAGPLLRRDIREMQARSCAAGTETAQPIDCTRDLIRLKRTDPVLSAVPHVPIDGAVLSTQAFLLRYFSAAGEDRLLIVNLGTRSCTSTPLPSRCWLPLETNRGERLLATEAPEYGGSGAPEPDCEEQNWMIQGQSAVLLAPGPKRQSTAETKEKDPR